MSTEAAAPTASPPSSPKPVTADAAAIAEEAGADAEVPTADEAPIDTTMNDTNENDAAHSSSPPRPEDEPAATTSNTTTKTDPVIRPDLIEPRIPAKKDATLREFLGKMDDYAPIIPDAVTAHYLTLAGLPPPPETPLPLARLLALATQKFIADIAADAYQYARIRTGHTTSNTAAANAASLAGLPGGVAGAPGAADAGAASGGAGAGGKAKDGKGATLGVQRPGFGGGGAGGSGGGKTVLTMEDLGCAVGEYGVNVRRGEFYR